MSIKLKETIESLNAALATSRDSEVALRNGVILSIETILHKFNKYGGFSYLTENEVCFGSTPGVYYDEQRNPYFEHTDSTRRKYHVKGR
jgi:hypothetical protein